MIPGTLLRLFALAVGAACALGLTCCDIDGNVSEMKVLDHDDWYFEMQSGPADKDCHAKFRLTIRWNMEERFTDPAQLSPFIDSTDLRFEFRASGGTFTPFQFGPLKDSVASGDGWAYTWYWTDDVGAKNEERNPTFYEIRCSAPGLDYLTPPPDKPKWWQVWVQGTIDYVEWD